MSADISWREALGTDRLLVAGFGETGGGLYDLADGRPDPIDDLATAGISLGGERLWRLLRAPGEQTGTCEVIGYDTAGVHSYLRVDDVRDPHDVCFVDGALHITSSWDNAVWRIAADGAAQMVWQGSTTPDSWHPNSLFAHEGSLHVCAFGRFNRHKGWRADAHRGQGFVTRLVDGVDVLFGLDAPHDPRPAFDGWWVCESSTGMLTAFDPEGRRRRSIHIGHYARGLAIVGHYAFVGVSAHRNLEERRGEVVVVDLDPPEGNVLERIGLPCREVYAVLAAPAALVAGVRRGFATNASRAAEQVRFPGPPQRHVALAAPDEAGALAGAGEPHPIEELHGAVEAPLPEQYVAGGQVVVSATVRNDSAFSFVTVPPQRMGVAARWFPINEDGTEGSPLVGVLAPFPTRIDPGGVGPVEVVLHAPPQPGPYRLCLALQQVNVAWFGVRQDVQVEVVPAPVSVVEMPAPEVSAGEPAAN